SICCQRPAVISGVIANLYRFSPRFLVTSLDLTPKLKRQSDTKSLTSPAQLFIPALVLAMPWPASNRAQPWRGQCQARQPSLRSTIPQRIAARRLELSANRKLSGAPALHVGREILSQD